MQSSFTLEDVAKYSLEVFLESRRNIKKAEKNERPSAVIIQNILQYSRALTVCKSEAGRPLLLLMN